MASVNSTSNTDYSRLTGMVSGFDTDVMIKQMLSVDRAKVQKVEASIQIANWQTDAYRDITSTLQSFYNKYFDTLSTTNISSENMFASFSTSYGKTTDSNYVTVTARSGAEAGQYSIKSITAATAAALEGINPSKPVESSAITVSELSNISNSNNTISITYNGVTKDIILPTDGSIDSLDKLKQALNQEIEAAFGADKITVGDNVAGDGISFNAVRNTDYFIIGSSGSANGVLGLTNSSLTNKVDATTKLSSMTNSIGQTYDSAATNYDIQFTINGKGFKFKSQETSILDIMNQVNADATINASMSYDFTSNKFTIKSKGTGVTDKVEVADQTGTLMTKLGIAGTDNGSDASILFSNGTEIVRSSNSFTYDGLSYIIKQDYNGVDPIDVTVNSDTTKTYDFIKGFVDEYNKIVEKLNTKILEKKYSDYTPLTEEQKDEMSEDQITKWEEKAKSGLLRNDSILSGIASKLRSVLYDTVNGTGVSLSSIGITTTSDYTQNGKLVIDEDKLKEALATKGDQITKLFTAESDKSYYDTLGRSSLRAERYNESGIAQRMSDIIQDAIRTSTDNDGKKGSLLEKAGVVGTRSEYNNLLYKEIEDYNDRLKDLNYRLTEKEDALYAKFTAMESALSKMNSQSSYISQMFSSGS